MVAGDVNQNSSIMPRASVARLTLSEFRCYESQRMEVGPAPVVLSGPNGAGKTNVLEALSFSKQEMERNKKHWILELKT